MASKIEIFNQALIKVGSDPVVSEQDSKGSRTLAAIYEVKRDAELAAHPWTFAITRAKIPASSTASAFGWARSYPVPAGFLRLVEVGQFWVMYDAGQPARTLFEIEGRAILTDEASPLSIRYVQRIDNPGLFSPLFVEALACRLALEIAEPVASASAADKQALQLAYREALATARRANAIERPPQPAPDTSWWTARA